MKKKTENNELQTEGRVLRKAALVYDIVQPVVTLGQENRLNKRIADILNIQDAQSVLDIGCGTGLLTYAIAAKYPKAELVGIDASEEMIAVAQKKRCPKNCQYKAALAEAIPFEDGKFDVVVSALFFHHVNKSLKQKVFQEIKRVLKPNGILVIADIGKPYTMIGKFMAYSGWVFLRQPEIKENIDGMVPCMMDEFGFGNPVELMRASGYIYVWKGVKSTSL